MKKTKAILMALCAVLLVAASVMGTLAYLTSTDTVTNTFTVGKVEITLDEADVNADGTPVQGADRVDANEYHLLPGHTYAKDPIVHVDADSEDCYLFVKVVNEIAAIEEKGTTEAPATTTVAAQMAAKGWKAVDGQTGVYVYTNKTENPVAVEGGANVTVFEKFVIDDNVNNTTLAGYNNKTITVTAYAVQADGFETKTAAQIWGDAGFT